MVVISGARQVGKSTLAELVLHRAPQGISRFLDDPVVRAAAAQDPVGFVQHEGLMLIDEVQRVPDLWLTIKREVDRDPKPGRFLLTGSARLLGLRQLPDALVGRSETIELWPLSQGEIEGTPDGFVDALFAQRARIQVPPSGLRRRDYLERAHRGGYPEALRRTAPRRRSRFFANYVADLLDRDIRQVADIARGSEMRRLVSLLAAQTGGLLSVNRLAGELAITAPTVRRYIETLETIFLVRRLPAWSANATTRAVATPKLIFLDSGLAAHLAGNHLSDAAEGPLLESFVLAEIARQLEWSTTDARLYHYRDRDGHEVDALIEDDGGRVAAVEVKASETVRSDDFRGLRHLQARLGNRFHAGIVLYCGNEALPYGPHLGCLPVSALWTAGT